MVTTVDAPGASIPTYRLLGRKVLVSGLAVGLLAAGCGDQDPGRAKADDDATVQSTTDASQAAPVPDLSYADVQLVPGIGDWTREPIDDSVEATMVTSYVDSADNAVVVEVQDYLNGAVTYDPGFVPAYWEKAPDLAAYDNGFTCATLVTGPSCYRLLTDGIIEVDCNEGVCSKSPQELSEVFALFYTAFAGGSTAGGTTDEEEACAGLDLTLVDEQFAPWIAGGGATADLDESVAGESYACYVTFPPGSFGEDGAGLSILRHRYESATQMTAGACDFGGTEPEEVFSAATTCKQQIDAVDEYSAGVQVLPGDSGGGIVVSQNEAVRAEPGEYWWQVSLTSVTFDADYAAALAATAASLP